MVKGFDISDLEMPVAVWKAVEGDKTELLGLLRSDKRLNRKTREALADWLEGKLKPVKWPVGRRPIEPALDQHTRIAHAWFFSFGHDTSTELGVAGFRYALLRRFIRRKGWHRRSAGSLYWSPQRLLEAVASRQEIDAETFGNYLRRPRPRLPKVAKEDYRRAVALKVRRS
jgi:hypothetical protein